MKYIVYTSNRMDTLSNEVKIGEADNFEDACQVLDKYLESIMHITTPYWRYSFCSGVTFIDFGSWSRFGAIVPAESIEEIEGEKSND